MFAVPGTRRTRQTSFTPPSMSSTIIASSLGQPCETACRERNPFITPNTESRESSAEAFECRGLRKKISVPATIDHQREAAATRGGCTEKGWKNRGADLAPSARSMRDSKKKGRGSSQNKAYQVVEHLL